MPVRIVRAIALVLALAAAAPAAAQAWADPAKRLRVAFEIDVTGFDPAATQDLYSGAIEARIFDALYAYDYLARPAKLVPNAAAAMPEISADGRTWTIRLKRGIRFADDAAFGGRERELTAQDFVYSWKRVLDPRVRSPGVDLIETRLTGAREAIAKARATGRFDYDAPIEGLRALDRHTLQLELVEPDYTFLPYLASATLSAVAREVVARYGDESGRVMAHPVGTGPYRLKEWRRGHSLVLEANPGYREEFFPDAPQDADTATRAVAAAMKGKRIPQIGIVEVAIIEESAPRLLAFDRGDLDHVDLRYDLALKVVDEAGNLRPSYAKRGVTLGRGYELTVTYAYFNMDDATFGGYTPERVALRRAICTAYDIGEEIRVIRQGQGRPATQPIPPDVPGHVTDLKDPPAYDPALARALLDRFGYKAGGGGLRTRPGGGALVLEMASEPDATARLFDELWQRSLQAVGIRVEFRKQKWPELYKLAHEGKLAFWELGLSGGVADYYMQQFYGPSAGSANLSRFRNAEFDELFRASRRTGDPVERMRLYARMTRIVAAYNPWCPKAYRIGNTLSQPQVKGYRKNPYYQVTPWQYLDLDTGPRPAKQ